MNTLQASIVESLDEGGEPYLGLRLRLDGQSLLDIVRQAEEPMAAAEGAPELAGAYGWVPMDMGVLAALRSTAATEEKTVTLLDCPCGVPGCWPLRSRLSFSPQQVVWSDFEQGHRRGLEDRHWRYTHVAPFVFDRAAYERALDPAALQSITSPRTSDI